MAAAVLIPWRGGCPHREAALAYVVPKYPPPVTLATSGAEHWCKAAAVANGLAITKAEVLVIADADVWCAETRQAIAAVLAGAAWAVPHIGVSRLTEAATALVLAGVDPDTLPPEALDEPPYRAHLGGGIVVIRRDVYEQVPLDPRFIGWGREDDSWAVALKTLIGRPVQLRGRLWHLWHPSQPRPDRKHGNEANEALYQRYLAANHSPARMRALIEEFAHG